VGRLMSQAQVPKRYEHCELANFGFTDKNRTQSLELAKTLSEKFVHEFPMNPPFGLLLMGPPGIGKTHLAVGIIKELIRSRAIPCLFRTFPDLLKEIQMSYSPVSLSSELSLLQPVLDTEILLLDELGAQTATAWVRETVGYILNHRYNENKVTILTTNYLDKEDLQDKRKSIGATLIDRIGEPMRSRLYEMCKTVVMKGDDFRQIYKQDEHRI
jgi:DNA replication protein DnaC